MSASRRQAVWVGLFVLGGVVLLAGGILAVGDIREMLGRKVVVHTSFDNVNGLQEGGNIWFSGVKVGTVRDIRFGDGSTVDVDLAIDPKAVDHIPADVKTRVGSDALLGNKIVVLYEGTKAPPLVAGAVLEAGDVLSNEEILAMVQENNKNLLAITDDLKIVTADLAAGRGSAGRALGDEALYDELTQAVDSLGTTADRIGVVSVELATFAHELNREGNLPHDLVTDRESYESIASSAKRLEEVTTSASALVANLEKSAGSSETPVGVALNDPTTARDLQSAVHNLDESARLLAQDLDALQHTILLRRYFKKRAKAAAEAGAQDTDAAP